MSYPAPTVKPIIPHSDEHIRRHTLFFNKICNENELTNQRLTWNFVIQGFLFAAWAYCTQTRGQLEGTLTGGNLTSPTCSEILETIRALRKAGFVIGGTGIFVTLLIFIGAVAAQVAIVTIGRYWHTMYPEYKPNLPWLRGYNKKLPRKWNSHGRYLPGFLGGGQPITHLFGACAPLLIPLVIAGAWCFLLKTTPKDPPDMCEVKTARVHSQDTPNESAKTNPQIDETATRNRHLRHGSSKLCLCSTAKASRPKDGAFEMKHRRSLG